MKSFAFTIIASGLDHEADDFEDSLFEAGCDDATVAFARGVVIMEFEREARNLSHAVRSAVDDVTRAGARVLRVEPDYLVSLAEIAERSRLTRAAITHYASGERGQDFPRPVARVSSSSPLWNWIDVARWLHHRRQVTTDAVVAARIVKAANDALTMVRSGESG